MIMENIMLIAVGVCLAVIGILNCMGNIDSIHSYNRTRITEETRKPYGRAVGTGSILIGASLAVCSIVQWIFPNGLVYLGVIPGCVAGLILMVYGQIKYNRGFF